MQTVAETIKCPSNSGNLSFPCNVDTFWSPQTHFLLDVSSVLGSHTSYYLIYLRATPMQCYTWFYCYIIASKVKKTQLQKGAILDASMHRCILGSVFETKDGSIHVATSSITRNWKLVNNLMS